MKRTLLWLAALLVAGSLAAATETPATPQTSTAAPDSPLVAAAKKSNRKGKKRIVITDATVRNSTGHLSTTTKQNEILARSEKPAEVSAESKEKEKAAEREKAAKAAAEAKQKETARRVTSAEENRLYDEDPSSPAPTSTSSQPQPSKPHDSQRP